MVDDKAAAPAAIDGDGRGGVGKEAPLGVKLRRAISEGKRAGLCTPAPSWKLEEPGPSDPAKVEPQRRSVSARKLGAGLWEIQDLLPMSTASRRGPRVHHRRRDGKALEDGHDPLKMVGQEDWPHSASSLRRHIEASLDRHQNLIERNSQIMQPVSPASYTSSFKIAAPFDQPIARSIAVDLKGKLGDAEYSLKTSTELFKVLNHIWSLEEQHESNAALVKELKLELEHAQTRIQELMQEQHHYRIEMDHLIRQVTEDKLTRKNKEQQNIKAAVQLIKDELEDERRLRRRSESLHRKLGKELSEAKSAFMNAEKDLEKMRQTNGLLEDLCDAFANGMRDYEQEVRVLKQKSVKVCGQKVDRLVLHISEAWLDEREQMKIAEAQGDPANKIMVADRLRSEIEAFIHASRSDLSNNGHLYDRDVKREINLRRQSLESVHLNGTGSAPQEVDDDDDSVASDLHCFELNMASGENVGIDQLQQNGHNIKEKSDSSRKPSFLEEKMVFPEKRKNHPVPSNSHMKPEELKADGSKLYRSGMQPVNRAQGTDPHSINEYVQVEANQVEHKKPLISGKFAVHEDSPTTKVARDRGCRVANSVNFSEISDCRKVDHENSHGEESQIHCFSGDQFVLACDGIASGDLNSSLDCRDQKKSSDFGGSRSSAKLAGVSESTLKARLLEARLEGQQARLKASRGSSAGGTRS